MIHSYKWIAILRKFLLAVACIATLLALFIVEENWRGNRAWEQCERDLKAKNVCLDFAALQPAPIPDKENFFKAPLLSSVLYEPADNTGPKEAAAMVQAIKRLGLGGFFERGANLSDFREGLRRAELDALSKKESPAAELLAAMKPFAPLLDEMREAARSRPQFQLKQRSFAFGEPRLAADNAFSIGKALCVRALAELELGQTAEAYSDIFAAERYSDGLSSQPETLLTILVGAALQECAAKVMYEGCRRHAWNEAQLAEFQKGIDASHPLERFQASFAIERIGIIQLLDIKSKILENTGPFWMIHGWGRQNMVVYCEQLDALLFSRISVDPERILPKKEKIPGSENHFRIFTWLSRQVLANMEPLLIGFGADIDRLRLVSIAIAIERYRLAYGRHPEALEQLTPVFLATTPKGVFDGKPVSYEAQADGSRLLRFSNPPKIERQHTWEDSTLLIPKA